MNQRDTFREQLNSVFSDFEAPVPHDGWERLERSLNTSAQTKNIRRNWYIASAAATVAILLGSLFFLKSPQSIEQNLPNLAEETISDKIKSTDKHDAQIVKGEPVAEKEKKSNQSKQIRQKQEILIAKQTLKKESESPILTEVLKETPPKNIIIASQPEKEEIPAAEEKKIQPDEKRIVSRPDQNEIDRLVQEFAESGKRDVFIDEKSKNKRRTPLMLALNAKGGIVSSHKTLVNSPMTLRSASASTEKVGDNKGDGYSLDNAGNKLSGSYDNTTMLYIQNTANNVAEMEHDQPVSFGLTLSTTIVDRLSVETGLVYTYLFSRAKNTSVDFQNQETQHFHYLGVPLNINYNFVNIGKLGLFISVGGLIEKDVYGKRQYQAQVIHNDILDSESQEWTIEKISLKNPQLSVNAGVGAFYPIYGGFNLYAKIGGSYYFDAKNYEYKTIYSDRKIVMDLNAGIRFDF